MRSCWVSRLVVVAVGFLIACSNIRADKEMRGPIIMSNKSDIILKSGQNFTIICKSNTPVQIKQQDISEYNVESDTMNLRNLTSSDAMFEFETALDLFNVNKYTIGYYACFDSTVDESTVLNNLLTEPNNTEHVAYFYIYVDDTGTLLAPMRQLVMSTKGAKVVLECRPTTPDVNVTLLGEFPDSDYQHYSYSPKIGFTFSSDGHLDMPMTGFTCNFVRELKERTEQENIEVYVQKLRLSEPPDPKIESSSIYFVEGETFSLNCTVEYELNSPVILNWSYPIVSTQNVRVDTNEHSMSASGTLYKNLTIFNATAKNEGDYICVSSNVGHRKVTYRKIYANETGFLELTKSLPDVPIETKQKTVSILTIYSQYPPATFSFYKNDKEIPVPSKKYKAVLKRDTLILYIYEANINDTGNYTIVATNKYNEKNLTYDLRIRAAPVLDFGSGDKFFLLNSIATLQCQAVGYTVPKIKWFFKTETGEEQELAGENEIISLTKIKSTLKIPAHTSGNITCSAENENEKVPVSRRFLIHDVYGGFGIENVDNTWFSEGQEVVKQCYASKYLFDDVTWLRDDKNLTDIVIPQETQFSYIAQLKINSIALDEAGYYKCVGYKIDGSEDSQIVQFTVAERRLPEILDPVKEADMIVKPFQPIRLTCQANAVPPPIISWYKDGELVTNNTTFKIYTENIDRTTVNSTIDIGQMFDEYKGKYQCAATSRDKTASGFYNLIIEETSTYKSAIYLSIIGVVVFFLVLLIVYLVWKIRKEKQFRKELAAAGLLYFKEGVTKSLNPDLGIDEQAELLPYDERFEFPPEKLNLGKQLGAGAFGVVYKAEARGIINAEETTPVAVKMVKKTADNMYIKALASELKIMVHLGKHVNIVNLLGACTKNVGKRELVVIVEYCKFGNIHNYMQRHREVFIDQLTDNKEKNLGRVNRAFSCTGSSGTHSDYFGSNHTQETDHTFVNTANTNRSGRKDNANQTVVFVRVSETGYVQPEWRSNYESDYSFDGRNPRPLTSRDLLAWAFQIARGMEYLASRKVLHGDLAARNVLLAEDNVVKICDFGLARSIYKNDEYKKQENSPLPVKWLAIECMTDRIFSTQSDVWSFGIVLWELFSLAKTPYPNVSPTSLVQWLSDGHRLEKPQYADDRVYDVMKRCWEQKPTMRPNFSQLQEILGSFLEDNVRNHYVDLNSAFADMNIRTKGQEDYLAMMSAPDYNNMVTPSPHHYVNDINSFFPPTPTQLLHDDEGYLQMSPANKCIFSPRSPIAKFDFDERKLNPKSSGLEHTQGSESTPMLTLNSLPANSGSESDHDGMSPYLKMCPKIDEETDEVFEVKQYNFKNAKNNQNRAVSNPTYITLNVDLEKKPQNISNNYINVNVPNGLVK